VLQVGRITFCLSIRFTSVLIVSLSATGTRRIGCLVGGPEVGMECFTVDVQPCGPAGSANIP